MLKIIFSILFFQSINICAQVQLDLHPEERAYLFHIVKKSPILNNSLGRYFDYKGPDIRFMNKELNYDSIESIIINDPLTLQIFTGELAKAPKGILAEAANKMALWELNKILLLQRSTSFELARYKPKFLEFESLLSSQLPSAALQLSTETNTTKPNKKLFPVLNPSLSYEDKAAMLSTLNFLTPEDQLATMNAVNETINLFVEKRAKEIYFSLGGVAETFVNELIAAGDGSETSGLLNEREKDESGKWNKGLPKAVGLFPYQSSLIEEKNRKKTTIQSDLFPVLDFQTVGENRLTQLHFDVWGYNSAKQTTVVIERNGLSYHLFGSVETRFLAPDSNFSSGKTFQAMINDFQRSKIDVLYEKIYGKNGFDKQIEDAKKRKDETELALNKKDKGYSDMGKQPIYTKKRAPRSVKKAKKKAAKNPGTEFKAQPTTKSHKGRRGKGQAEITGLFNEYQRLKKLIAELEIEKANAIETMARYQTQMDLYKQSIGYNWAKFTENNGLYTFQDSSTFDILTQEFTFKEDTLKTPFEVRLLCIPDAAMAKTGDEVMMHVNLIDSKPGFDAKLNLNLLDAFEPNEWKLNNTLITKKDSVAIRTFFEAILEKKPDFQIKAYGNGVGDWNGIQTIRASKREEWLSYPGDTKEEQKKIRMDSSMVRLRCTDIKISIGRELTLEINTFTDPVVTNLKSKNSATNSEILKYGLTGNDYLSSMRSMTVLKQLKSELNILAGNFLTRDEARQVIDEINKAFDKAKINVGSTSFKPAELE